MSGILSGVQTGTQTTATTTTQNPPTIRGFSLIDLLLFLKIFMDAFVEVCRSFGVPVWVSPLLCAAGRMRGDRARRRKAYRLMQRTLVRHHVGVRGEGVCPPTYVYPEQVKMLIRAVFPQEVCNYADPSHPQVVYLTMEDLHKVNLS